MAAGSLQTVPDELRLVLLGRTGAGKSTSGNAILGRPAFQPQDDVRGEARCLKHKGEAAGRQLVVVTSPDWFSSACSSPEEAGARISSFVALSTPGPHAFLLCVPADRPLDGEARALAALERLLGPAAVSAHTLVLLTHAEELEEEGGEKGEWLAARADLLELVDLCGGRYHVLRGGGGGEESVEEEERRRSVEALLGKVEAAVRENGGEHHSCELYRRAEARVGERRAELAAGRGEGGEEGGEGGEEEEAEREEAERSVGDLGVDVGGLFPPATPVSSSSSSPPPSFLRGLWERVTRWLRRLPHMVRREALLGALVGLFVGGPFGGMLGATVGSVATEVGRRKTQKKKE